MSDASPDLRQAIPGKAQDRRVHARHQIAPRLYVLLDGASSDGILNDASEGGVALDIVGPKPEGETLLLDFEMSETGPRFEATPSTAEDERCDEPEE